MLKMVRSALTGAAKKQAMRDKDHVDFELRRRRPPRDDEEDAGATAADRRGTAAGSHKRRRAVDL